MKPGARAVQTYPPGNLSGQYLAQGRRAIIFRSGGVVDWRSSMMLNAALHPVLADQQALNRGLPISGEYQTAKAYSFPRWVAQVAPFLERAPGQSLSRLRLQPPIYCALGP